MEKATDKSNEALLFGLLGGVLEHTHPRDRAACYTVQEHPSLREMRDEILKRMKPDNPPKTEETTFGELARGDVFFTRTYPPEKSSRRMKMESGEGSFCCVNLDGDLKGCWLSISNEEPVLKIIE